VTRRLLAVFALVLAVLAFVTPAAVGPAFLPLAVILLCIAALL
jgi:hypothetical protein